jgi:CheY-like chemotaxis protein
MPYDTIHTKATATAQTTDREPVVLIVEDEPLLRGITAEFLRLSGYAVLETHSSAEAIALLSSGRSVDLVFSDVYLPGAMDGVDLAGWLHRQRPHVPVLLTSGHGEQARERAVGRVGGWAYLPKPYHQEDLTRRISTLLDASRLRPQ